MPLGRSARIARVPIQNQPAGVKSTGVGDAGIVNSTLEIDMGRMKENPRYNVISLRVSDSELAELDIVVGNGTRQEYLLTALTEKFINDRQARIDALVGANR